MQSRNLSDRKLHEMLVKNVRSERVLLTEILRRLLEVEKRRLFCDFKCTSTFDYAVRELGYSEPQAGRRIQAMRLMRDVSDVEEKLTSGELTLTSAAQVQQFINKEERAAIAKSSKGEETENSKGRENGGERKAKVSDSRFTPKKKSELVEKVSGLSSRKTEQVLISESKEPQIHKEKMRQLGNDRLELKFSIASETQKKMQKLKGLLAHSRGELNLEDFFAEILELATAQIEKKKRLRSGLAKSDAKRSEVAPESIMSKNLREARDDKVAKDCESFRHGERLSTAFVKKKPTTAGKKTGAKRDVDARGKKLKKARITVPVEIVRDIWQRAKGCCENCGSNRALEFEHKNPVGKGGANTEENLELLCRSCNQRAAIQEYGWKKMSSYIRSSRVEYGKVLSSSSQV